MSFNPHTFKSEIFSFIRKQQLVKSGQRLLLAVSGGLDSMALLDFFYRYALKKFQLEIIVAHFEHGIHSSSQKVQQWLDSYCQQLSIEFVTAGENIPRKLEESPKSSLEAVAREHRYAWLYRVARENNCQKIVTAHTASDQCELVVMRLVRGGISGLSGMRAQVYLEDNIPVIRPFLSATRTTLEAYIAHYHLEYLEDPTNLELNYFRNRIRHQVLPLLIEENLRLEAHLSELSEIWQDEQDYFQAEANAWFETHCLEEGLVRIPLGTFNLLPRALQRGVIRQALIHWLGSWRVFTTKHIEAIRALTDSKPGKVLQLPLGLRVEYSDHHTLLFH